MRCSTFLTSLAASTLACSFATAQSAPQGGDLREEIRRIVREEVRAALREAHAGMPAPTIAAKVAPAKKAVAKLQDVDAEMEKLDHVVKQLEVMVEEGDKATASKPAHGAHTIQLGDGHGTIVLEGHEGTDLAKVLGGKAHGMTFTLGEDKAGAAKAKEVEGFEFHIQGDGEAKPAKVQKVKIAEGMAMPMIHVLGDKAHGVAGSGSGKAMTFRITCDDGKCKVEPLGGECCPGECEGTIVVKTDCADGKCKAEVVGGLACCDEAKPAKTKAKKTDKAKKQKQAKKQQAAMVFELEDCTGSCEGGACEGQAKAECCEGEAKAKAECCEGEAKAKGECCEGEAKAKAKGDCGTCVEGLQIEPIQIELKDLKLEPMQIKVEQPAVRVRQIQAPKAKDPRVL